VSLPQTPRPARVDPSRSSEHASHEVTRRRGLCALERIATLVRRPIVEARLFPCALRDILESPSSSGESLGSTPNDGLLLRDYPWSRPAHRLSARGSPDWVSPLIAASPAASTPRGSSKTRYVPSSGFLSLSTAYSATRLDGLVPSRRHVQGSSPFRGFSPPAAVPDSSSGRAPLPLAPTALTRASSSCHPIEASTSRLSSARGRVARRWGLANDEPAPLFGFCSLQASDTPRAPVTRCPSTHGVPESGLRLPADRPRAPPASIQGARRRPRLRVRPPARSFLPSESAPKRRPS